MTGLSCRWLYDSWKAALALAASSAGDSLLPDRLPDLPTGSAETCGFELTVAESEKFLNAFCCTLANDFLTSGSVMADDNCCSRTSLS